MSGKINFAAIHDALNASQVVPEWLPGGNKQGRNWFAANPHRNDSKPGSFAINLETGKWSDFATGDKGGDLVSLYAFLFHGGNNGEAARALCDKYGIRIDAEMRERAANNVADIDAKRPKLIMPVPHDVPQKPSGWADGFKHPKFGKASRVWEYRDAKGQLLFYIARYDVEPRKQIVPWSWCFDPEKNVHKWMMRGITGKDKRPLYGLDRLADMPDADVVMVEGEKAADAMHELLDGHAVGMSWLGGVEPADKVSVRALEGRRVILFPDFDTQTYPETHPRAGEVMDMHDQPGNRAMLAIAQSLKGIAREVIMIAYRHGERAPGWDVADGQAEGWTRDDVLRYIGQNARDPLAIARGETHAPKEAPTAPQGEKQAAPPRDYVDLDVSVNPFGWTHLSDKGQPMNTVDNLAWMLDEYGITSRYNETRKQVELELPGKSYSIDNRANCSLAELTSVCVRNRMPVAYLQDYVKLIADRHAYNPARDWIKSKPWDGVKRVQQLIDTVKVAGDTWLRDRLMYRWLLSAVAAVTVPYGFHCRGALVFTGGQGLGKTSWFRRLVPQNMGLVMCGAILDPSNKDHVTNVVSHWIVELGELDATFRKADIARLKSWITEPADKIRRPYDRVESEYQRRTVICASVNGDRYLVDDTGNSRWWTIAAVSIDYKHDIDMQQVFAELLLDVEAGEQWWLTPEEEEALAGVNTQHEAIDPVEEMILSAFDWSSPVRGKEMTATEVLVMIGFDKPNKAQATHASGLLRDLTGAEPRKTKTGRYFKMPKRMGQNRGNGDDEPF
jgi:predicted P-loop ATPase